jgi:ferredoxin
LKASNYLQLRLPCAGRIQPSLLFNALKLGISNIVSIQCEDKFCRTKHGTKLNAQRFALTSKVLKQLGYPQDTVKVIKYSHKALYNVDQCVGCGKCVFVCPYGALTFGSFGTPLLDNKMHGLWFLRTGLSSRCHTSERCRILQALKKYSDFANCTKRKNGSSLILAFVCQWSEFPRWMLPNFMVSKRVNN